MINKKNFKRVLEIIEASAKERDRKSKFFDYRTWFMIKKKHKTLEDIVKHPCGTTGCVGGWGQCLMLYDLDPKFELVNARDCNLDGDEVGYGDLRQASDALGFDDEDNTADTALLHWFGITERDAVFLFYGKWHARGVDAPDTDVCDKLRNIIKTGKVINYAFDKKYKPWNHISYEWSTFYPEVEYPGMPTDEYDIY